MTINEARKILAPPLRRAPYGAWLRFGDSKQIEARKLLEQVEIVVEIAKRCKNKHHMFFRGTCTLGCLDSFEADVLEEAKEWLRKNYGIIL